METLKLAREAIGKNDFVTAKQHYAKIVVDNPDNIEDNLEAVWFYLFGVLLADPIDENTAKNYKTISKLFYPTLEYIATFEEGKEKHDLVFAMINGFPNLKDAVHNAMIQLLVKDRTAIPMEDAGEVSLAPDVDKKRLADLILQIFGDKEPYCMMVANIWKELIAERYQWSKYRNFQDRGKELWFDELAKKIKKYDPSYEMPQFKQAGCVSSGDAAKVKPGE